jgi:tetratricopeptide (TPR) repeat protein
VADTTSLIGYDPQPTADAPPKELEKKAELTDFQKKMSDNKNPADYGAEPPSRVDVHMVDKKEIEKEVARLSALKRDYRNPRSGSGGSASNSSGYMGTAGNKADTDNSGPQYIEGKPAVPELSVAAPTTEEVAAKSQAYFAEADTKLKMNDFNGAIAAADESIRLQPNNPRAYNLKAVAYNRLAEDKKLAKEQRQFMYTRAEDSATQATRLAPDYPAAYESLAWAQLRQDKNKEAIASASKAIQLNPRSSMGYAIRAYAYEALGEKGMMMEDIVQASTLNPAQFTGKLKQARSGRKIGPGSDDSWQLADLVAGGNGSGIPMPVAAGLLVLLAVLAGGGVYAWKRFSPQPQAARLKELAAGLQAQPAPAPAQDGLLAGKYQLTRIIGKGGMGQVWEAKDKSLDRIVAVKKMVIDGEFQEQARGMYLKEARTLASLHHPGIVDIYEILDLPEGLFLVFELLSGKTVQHILAEQRRIPFAKARDILRPVCDALEFAHASAVVHRDLKPANIMVTDPGYIKVMDFGIARRIFEGGGAANAAVVQAMTGGSGGNASPIQQARTQTIAGTPAYMAPEAEAGVVTSALDVYALGVCLYEMVTGELPFGQTDLVSKMNKLYVTAGAKVPGLPPELDALIDRALDPNVETRMRTAAEFRQALAAVPDRVAAA